MPLEADYAEIFKKQKVMAGHAQLGRVPPYPSGTTDIPWEEA